MFFVLPPIKTHIEITSELLVDSDTDILDMRQSGLREEILCVGLRIADMKMVELPKGLALKPTDRQYEEVIR